MTVAPAKLVTRREGTREVPPSRKREELTGRALEGYWLLATGSRYSMSFVQTRLSSSSFCLYTKLDSLVASLHPHRHIATTSTLPITALHFTSLCTALLPAATSPPPVPPLYRPTYRRYLLFPTARPRPIARLAFARYQHPDPHYGSNFVSAGIAPHHEEPAVILEAASSITIELEQSPFTPHCKPPFSSPPRLLLLLCSLFTISLSPHSKPRSACHPRF